MPPRVPPARQARGVAAPQAHHMSINNHASASASASATPTGQSNVRRTLFQTQLTRRPTPTSSASSVGTAAVGAGGSALAGADVFGLGGDIGDVSVLDASGEADVFGGGDSVVGDVSSDEIVVRNEMGEARVLEPLRTEMDDVADDADEEERLELERERQRLAEAVRRHRQYDNRGILHDEHEGM